MQVTETAAEGLRREFKIVIPAKDFQSEVERRLTEIGRSARLPGFRPGKVPLPVLKKRYGKSIMGEILERKVSDSSTQVMSDHGIRPAGQPKIEIVSFDDGKDLEYTMAVEQIPEIKPMDFAQLALERLKVEVPDSEVEETLERLAQRQRKTKVVEEPRGAAKGDVLVVDFVGSIDGAEFAGGSATGFHIELGADGLIPGFADQLVGAKTGEHRDVNVTFPEDYPGKEVAGKAAVFAVDVKELREPIPAAIDDELAKSVGLENLEAMRKDVRRQIENDYAGVARSRLKRQLLDKLSDAHDFTVPAGLLDAEFEGIWQQVESDKAQGRLDADDEGKSDDQLKSEYRAIAERRVKLGLLLSEVGRINNIQIANEEVSRAVMNEARRYPGQERKVVEHYQKSPQALAQLRAPIYEDKVVDFIVELAKVSERKVTPAELSAEMEAAAAGEAAPGDDKAGEGKTAETKAKKTTARKKKPAKGED
jgi:trigger factor